MVLLKILLAGWLLPPSLGDGPSKTSTATSTTSDPNAASTTSDPNVVNISGASPDVCNPYRGYRYISIGAAGGIASGTCGASWDLYEVEMWETYTAAGRLSGLQALSPTGHDSGYPPAKAVDGSMDSFWAGDHDVGMSCSCWDDSKKDGQLITIGFQGGASPSISTVRIRQGGNSDRWAVKRARLHCHDQVGLASASVLPLEFDVSMGDTLVTCGLAGCSAELSPAYHDTCTGVASAHGAGLARGIAAVLGGLVVL